MGEFSGPTPDDEDGGAGDVGVDQVLGQPVLEVQVDRQSLARHGIPADAALASVEAIGGLHVGEVIYGNIGVPERLEFSVIGAAANQAAAEARSTAGAALDAAQGAQSQSAETEAKIDRMFKKAMYK